MSKKLLTIPVASSYLYLLSSPTIKRFIILYLCCISFIIFLLLFWNNFIFTEKGKGSMQSTHVFFTSFL